MSPAPHDPARPLAAARTVPRLLVAFLWTLAVGALARAAWLDGTLPLPAPAASGAVAARPGPAPGVRPSPLLLVVADGLTERAAASMPTLGLLAREGASGVAITGEPTMSAPCIRTILTGRSPDLWSAFRNFAAVETAGTLVEAIVAQGGRAAHSGDAVIPRLCGRAYRREDVLELPRVAFREVTGLDGAAFPDAVRKASDDGVDVLTVHLVTVDLTGHAHGADSEAYRAACAELDDRLAVLVGAFRLRRPEATILVAADHGLSRRGTHGAGETEARRAPFVLVGPRIERAAGLEIEQTAIAPTVAAALGLPPPPLSESPPVLEVLWLSQVEQVAALEGFVRARSAAWRSADREDRAAALERSLAALPQGPSGARLHGLRALARETTPAERRVWLGALAAGLALLGAFLPVRTGGAGSGTARLVAAVLLAVVTSLGAVLTAYGAWLGALVPADVGRRTLLVGAALVAFLLALVVERAARARVRRALGGRPDLVLAAAGASLGLTLASRLGVDAAIHTPLLTALLAVLLLAGLLLARPAAVGGWGRSLAAVGLAATALLGARAMEASFGEGWVADGPIRGLVADVATLLVGGGVAVAALRGGARPGERRLAGALAAAVLLHRVLCGAGDARTLLVACLAGAGLSAARSPGPATRSGIAGLALGLLALRVAASHAVGGVESLRHVDPAGAFFPGASGVAIAPGADAWREALGALARHVLLWFVLLAPALAVLGRGALAGARSRLLLDVAALLLAEAAALVLGMAVWGAWSWWAVVALPAFVMVLADLLAMLAAGAVLAPRGRWSEVAIPAPGAPAVSASG